MVASGLPPVRVMVLEFRPGANLALLIYLEGSLTPRQHRIVTSKVDLFNLVNEQTFRTEFPEDDQILLQPMSPCEYDKYIDLGGHFGGDTITDLPIQGRGTVVHPPISWVH